ncbi:hypothetical protein HF861_02135 [Faecalicoccus pleomorphus]|uniref:YitT family protein n=1 Tax=Faecalicoccus pleomorphus TaxID=1323 RepID=A0A7X9NGA0_9FIRM|nr:hypothetical protein [Faecalicoccus pleomorphus]NME43683.1 hypothetical protein [Faecalicoccus pleomorphus]
MKKIFNSIIKGFLATLLMGIGIALFIACELGSDPITVFLDGFNRVTKVPVSVIDQIINLVILFLAFIMNRNKIGINTIVSVLALGICIQIPTMLINPLKLALQTTYVRIIGILIGQLCLALSFAWMQSFKDGINALDCIIFKIMEITNFKYRTIRIIYDGCFISIGYLLGGVVGIGTIISLLTNGILVEQFKSLINYLNTIYSKFSERMVKNNG